MRSSGTRPIPAVHRRVDVVPGERRPRDPHGAPVVGVGPEDGPYDLGTTGADEPGDADDLTGAHLEGDVVEDAVAGEPFDGEQRRRRRLGALPGYCCSMERPTMSRTSSSCGVEAGTCPTLLPSRMTVTRSPRAAISSR